MALDHVTRLNALSFQKCTLGLCVVFTFIIGIQVINRFTEQKMRNITALNHHIRNISTSMPDNKNIPASKQMNTINITYGDMLAKCASSEKVIILTLVDSEFVEMAMNFYETSILKHNISNYLFVSLYTAACENLITNNINCFTYYNFEGGKQESSYMQRVFLKKMALRIEFVLEALK